MNVTVNYDRCEGHAVCANLVPSVFELDDATGQVRIIDRNPASSLQAEVKLAASRCPRQAITIAEG